MKITAKGQITIPRELRQPFGFLPGTEVAVVVRGNTLAIVKAEDLTPGEQLVQHLRTARTNGLTTDEIMKMTRG